MGNWHRCHIEGTCAATDVPALRREIGVDFANDRWTCLCCGGIAGLPNWARETISATGNLGERDYGASSVAEALNGYLRIAPSLNVKAHVGADYEADECEATVKLVGGEYRACEPEIDTIPEIDPMQMGFNLGMALGGRPPWA